LTRGARATRRVGVALVALVALVATSCVRMSKITVGNELGLAIERDDVLPEGAVWRSSMRTRAVCIFGVTDPAAQDRVVDGARESLRRIGGARGFKSLAVEFWSGEPPPREVVIHDKPAFRPQGPPPGEPSELNAPYAIRLVRTVEVR
jgi:hypothetical protein